MKNKNGKKGKTMAIVLILAVVLIGIYFLFPKTKTILEHKEPADISTGESGTGLDLRLYDADGNPIEIPDWFTTSDSGIFTIVRHPPAPTCTIVSQCSGYATNPNIMCWNGKCVLGNVASMDLGVNVQNPATSEITFLNVAPSLASPIAFNTNLAKTVLGSLAPGSTQGWMTTAPLSVNIWEGTQQTFSVTVQGTNEYTGQVISVSDSITLAFDTDPTGTFIVSVESPVPA